MSQENEKATELMAELIKILPGYSPLETPSVSGGSAERFALASMYKEKPYRDYLGRQIRLNISRLQDVKDLMGLHVQQGRIEVLKELFALSRSMFLEADKLDKSLEANEVKL